VRGGAGVGEAIKCLVNESPGRWAPLPAAPRPVNVYREWFAQGQGSVTMPAGTRHPSGCRHLMGVRGRQMPPWCLLTFGRQTWLVASCEEEEEEGCPRCATDLSVLGPSLTSWPRCLPLLACSQPQLSQQLPPPQTLCSIPYSGPRQDVAFWGEQKVMVGCRGAEVRGTGQGWDEGGFQWKGE